MAVEDDEFNFDVLRDAILLAMRRVGDFILTSDLSQLGAHYDVARVQKAQDDQTRALDIQALRIVNENLRAALPATKAFVISEENPLGEALHGGEDFPDILFIVDPVDNSDGAAHGDAAFSAITVYSRAKQTILAASVCDPYLSQIYYADESLDRAVKIPLSDNNDKAKILCPSARISMQGAFIAIYTLKANRLLSTMKAKSLLDELGAEGRVQCLGGAASLCRVASGHLDASVEFVKGFQAYDLFPGAYILRKAGGICAPPDQPAGVSLTLPIQRQEDIVRAVKTRQRFIAAANFQLFHQISMRLARDGLAFEHDS